MARLAPLKLGSPVCFDDRWKGRLSGLEITEHWAVVNVLVTAGSLFKSESVKLPMSSVTPRTDGSIKIAGTSKQAFAREIPPVATPARPVSDETPTSRQGTHFAGVVVDTEGDRVEEVLVSRGGKTYRVGVDQVAFEGKTLMFTATTDEIPAYVVDSDIEEEIKRLISADKQLQSDEKFRVIVKADAGVATLTGNVWVPAARKYIEAMARRVPGVVDVRDQITDDLTLESGVGQALAREGQINANVWVRGRLGTIIIGGMALSRRQSDDIEHTVSRVPGVRGVKNQLTVPATAPVARG